MNIDMKPVKSSQINAVGYDAASKTLAIEFKGGGKVDAPRPPSLYHYANVEPELFEDMMVAESVGSFFYKNIKPDSKKYPYTRIEKEKKDE